MTWNEMYGRRKYLQSQLQSIEKYRKQSEQLEQQITAVKRDVENYEQLLQRGRQQLEKLERPSFMNWLRELMGKKEELLDRNLEEVATHELKLIEKQMIKEDLQDDLIDIVYKMNAINEGQTQFDLQSLQQQMTYWLQDNAPYISQQLTDIIEQEGLAQRLQKEIDEAIVAGEKAIDKLIKARDSLKSAQSYSTWDTFFGGGLLATSMKHSQIEHSNSHVHEAQIALQRFQNELLDIQEMRHHEMNVSVDGLVRFADYFFDDIFSAWSVHSKISEANQQIQAVLDDVRNTVHDLQLKRNKVLDKIEQLQTAKLDIFSRQDVALFTV